MSELSEKSRETLSKPLVLNDGSGGLNNRDLPANIAPNEFTELENVYTDEGGYPGKKIPGAEVIQYAPIDPTPYAVDANSLVHYAFDEAGSLDSIIDDSPNSRNMTFVAANNLMPRATALFPIGAGLGRKALPQDNIITSNGSMAGNLFVVGTSYIDGLSALTMRGWAIIPDSFTGAPVNNLVRLGNPVAAFSNSGAILFGTAIMNAVYTNVPQSISNGFQLFRDWDATAGKNSSDPYVKFTLRTRGVAGTVTTLTSRYLPTNKMLEFKLTYDANTATVSLYVQGSLHATATVNGGGVVDDPLSGALVVAGNEIQAGGIFGFVVKTCAGVIFDEWEVANVVRAGFNFKKPRARWKEFNKSDGTVQFIGPAGDGLYMTIGDGNYTTLRTGLNEVNNWDMWQLGDIIYLCNGVDQPVAWDGTRLVSWFAGTAPLSLSNSASGASPAAGVYQYAYTYVYATEETAPMLTAPHTGVGTNINVDNILSRHSNASAIRIYRTKAGGSIFYLLREIDNDSTVVTLPPMSGPYVAGTGPTTDEGADGVADATLGTGAYTQMRAEVRNSLSPNPKYIVENFDRLFVGGFDDKPYQMDWTEPGLPDVILPISFVTGHGNKILTALSRAQGEVHAHKGLGGVLMLRGNSPANWTEFENLHPNIGCVDHFGIEYRTISKGGKDETDRTILVFPGPDGFYGYEGYEFFRVDDLINKTYQSLAYRNSTRLVWLTSTQAQWEAEKAQGGSASINIDADTYLPDGLTEVPGELRIVDQLEYIGLWHKTDGFVPVGVGGNKVIAMAKGSAEGEFLFAVSADANLYRTTDNWQTATVVATLGSLAGMAGTATDYRVNELLYVSVGGEDKYFVATSGTDDQGYIALWNQTTGNWENGAVVLSGPHFWQGDVPWRLSSSPTGDIFTNIPDTSPSGANRHRAARVGNLQINTTGSFVSNGQLSAFGNNFYINHTQKVDINFQEPTPAHLFRIWNEASVSSNGGAAFVGNVEKNLGINVITSFTYSGPASVGSTFTPGVSPPTNYEVAVGFHGAGSGVDAFPDLNNPEFNFIFTNRETALWQGGTFRPQMFWDSVGVAAVPQLYFVASGAEDANRNRTSTVYRMPATGTAVAIQAAVQSCIALTTDGTYGYFSTQVAVGSGGGFTTTIKKFLLTSGAVSTHVALTANYLPLRLSWNTSSLKLAVSGRFYNSASTFNSWTFSGFLAGAPTTGMVPLKTFTANGASGAFPLELVFQSDEPYAHFAIMQALQTGAAESVYKIGKNMAAIVSPATVSADVSVYQSTGLDSFTLGVQSQAIFVPWSDAAGSYLWSDRLYWAATRDTDISGSVDDAKPVQIGVPGNWTVKGTYKSILNNLGVFSAFDNFSVEHSGLVAFSMANGQAAAVPFSDANFIPVTPNQKITLNGNPVAPYAQWKAELTWVYTVAGTAISNAAPYVRFVNVAYFLGNANIPRIVCIHHQGRTRWSVARSGELTNDLEIIYQKNNRWTTAPGRRIVTYAVFRGDLVAFEDYTLIRMEKGVSWQGNLIRSKAVTGYFMNDTSDKYIRKLVGSLLSYINSDFPTKSGWLKITPMAAGVPLAAAWYLPITATAGEPLPVQTLGEMVSFAQGWARAIAFKIETSDDTTGAHIPAVNQSEQVQALMFDLRISPPRNILPVA